MFCLELLVCVEERVWECVGFDLGSALNSEPGAAAGSMLEGDGDIQTQHEVRQSR
jgi:hypothetical protein